MNNPFAAPPSDGGAFNLPGLPTYPKQTAWSFSVVNNHAKCPQKIKFTKIDRLPEPGNAAMNRGSEIHKAASALIEQGVNQELLSPHWTAKVLELRQYNGIKSELQLAFTSLWEPCAWYGPQVWGRVVVDAVYLPKPGVVQVIEFKTGKAYPEHSAQLRLYALAGFIMFPDAQESRAENWYFDGPPSAPPGYVAQRSALPRLKEEFAAFAAPLLNDDVYPARAGHHCRWCHFRKSNGGPCAHG